MEARTSSDASEVIANRNPAPSAKGRRAPDEATEGGVAAASAIAGGAVGEAATGPRGAAAGAIRGTAIGGAGGGVAEEIEHAKTSRDRIGGDQRRSARQ